MTNPTSKIIRAGLILLPVVLIVAGLLWWGQPDLHGIPVAAFMPDEISFIVNIRDMEKAWKRHWRHRQGPAPEAAFKEMLVALDEWDDWVKRYGEIGARLRMEAIQNAFFQVLGEDAWLIFGAWEGEDDQPGEGEVGLVALIRSDTPVKARVGPLADLLFENYQIDSGELEGHKVYAYHDDKLSRTLTFCQLKGWICVSMRQPGAGPLPEMIRQVRTASKAGQPAMLPPELARAWGEYDRNKAICVLFRPQVFWAHLRRFNDQRGRGFSANSETKLGFWQQRLDGVESISLNQIGPSLMNLDVEIDGPRPLRLSQSFAKAGGGVASPVANAGDGNWKRESGLSQMARIDMDLVFARSLLPLAGQDWDSLFEGMTDLDVWVPGLRTMLQVEMHGGAGEALPARLGLLAYASINPMTPALLFWLDRPPCAPPGQWPAPGSTLADSAVTGSGDLSMWIQPFSNTPASSTQSHKENQWLLFEEAVRMANPEPDADYGFMSLNFESISSNLERLPYPVLGKKVRRKVGKWHAISKGLSLALGGAVLRLGSRSDGWILEIRTP